RRTGAARRLELGGECLAVDLATAEQHPAERRRGAGRRGARVLSGELELEQVGARTGQLVGGGDDQPGDYRSIGPVPLAVELVDERLDDEQQIVPVAVLGRACDELALANRGRAVVGAIPEQQLAA